MSGFETEFLVGTDWLAEHLDDPDLRLFECTVFLRPRDEGGYRVESGRAEYEAARIPNAGFLDLQRDFSDNDQRLRFMMPSRAAFAEAAGRHGISNDSRIVLYDRLGSMWAARFWWMFRAMGAERVAVLDGGWTAWTAEGRETAAGPHAHDPAEFKARFNARRFAAKDEVLALSATGGCLINALGRDQHSGEDEGRTYGRPGHIPGAANVPAMELVDPATQRYKDRLELMEAFAMATAGETVPNFKKRVVTYCGGGIAASNDAFILSLLGYEDVAVYDASLSEWAADDSLPMVTEEAGHRTFVHEFRL